MSNFLGKTLLEAKKVGSAISKSAKEIGGAVGEATTTLAGHAKKSAKIAMLKAEIEQLYTKLGKAVFESGTLEGNDEVLVIIKDIADKKTEITNLERELDKCNCDHACGCESACDCDCDCNDCENDLKDDCDCCCEDENCNCDCHKSEKSEEDTPVDSE